MKISLPLSLVTVAGMASAADPSVMQSLKALKESQWEGFRAQGIFDPGQYNDRNRYARCRGGKAEEYKCHNTDVHGFLSHEEMGSDVRMGNDLWGMSLFLWDLHRIYN